MPAIAAAGGNTWLAWAIFPAERRIVGLKREQAQVEIGKNTSAAQFFSRRLLAQGDLEGGLEAEIERG
ncbi:MAG: hypothetical protein O9315_14550 [Beijerinckiaceae bacterium]|nr:hypothetical protein [Beijerinckiaceae bacterium]